MSSGVCVTDHACRPALSAKSAFPGDSCRSGALGPAVLPVTSQEKRGGDHLCRIRSEEIAGEMSRRAGGYARKDRSGDPDEIARVFRIALPDHTVIATFGCRRQFHVV